MSKRSRKSLRNSNTLAIDGHNVCYQCPEIANAMQQEMETGRRLFEQRVGLHRPWHIFYDGGPGGLQRRQSESKLSLHYSGGANSADNILIEWLRYQHQAITVISNDRELQMRAQALGAHCVEVHDFLDYIDQPENGRDIDEAPPSQAEIDFWTDQFS
ncbi:MAG: NYN domain-containing protein [Planctomycetes bacterium]|nr:NYN domain-containing protein [Planctomycetota bacterium]